MKRGIRMGKHKMLCVSFKVADPDRTISTKAEEMKSLFSDVPTPELYRMIFFQGLESMARKMTEFVEAKKHKDLMDLQPDLFGGKK